MHTTGHHSKRPVSHLRGGRSKPWLARSQRLVLPLLLATSGLTLLAPCLAPSDAEAARIRDIAQFRGIRENQLVGYGLVMGLDGTGDRKGTGFTLRSMSNLLESVGLTVSPEEMNVKNVAAVMVTATLPAFSKRGGRIDVTVASIGDASSLEGGILVQTPLEGADGRVYAVAQGPVSVGGFSADSPGGSTVSQNQVTVGRIPDGALVEQEILSEGFANDHLELALHRPDITTADRVARAIESIKPGTIAVDPATVRVPADSTDSWVSLMAQIGDLKVDPASPARIVVNERTGTIVAGGEVKVRPVAIAHGNLSIRIENVTDVYQPGPFSPDGATTATADQSNIDVSQDRARFVALPSSSSIAELAEALNTLGVTPRDVIAIFQALKEAGALDAELLIL
ncbi:MAG: flagellar basal body P-ring protein FlgI [Candidatus Eisenbacteria bacterium]|uniref:Flagellar P-ring protein n=1 Tax=Eiseniibacteriota bacterium TaxID=2212470 RepID=A0A956NG29_UNCEI|nr:flagellar basal body P-ring protein FlgI [Candidatus Eisenbacteria bacterium]MCB9466345.1 flagellar basal body P-ring protein FlgI [Candidatus Eisenbacteria bacterium]